MSRLNQKGFGFIPILFLVTLGLIGFVGWFVLHNQNTTVEKSALSSDECIQKPNQQELPVSCLPGGNRPSDIELSAPSSLDLSPQKSKQVQVAIKNLREFAVTYQLNVDSQTNVQISGLPQLVTIESNKTKEVTITVTPHVDYPGYSSNFQIGATPKDTHSDLQDYYSNTEVRVSIR